MSTPDQLAAVTDRLAEAVELLNAATDPAERVELIEEIRRLRAHRSKPTQAATRHSLNNSAAAGAERSL